MSFYQFFLITNNTQPILTSTWAMPSPLFFLIQPLLMLLLGYLPCAYTPSKTYLAKPNFLFSCPSPQQGSLRQWMCSHSLACLTNVNYVNKSSVKAFSLVQICMWIFKKNHKGYNSLWSIKISWSENPHTQTLTWKYVAGLWYA